MFLHLAIFGPVEGVGEVNTYVCVLVVENVWETPEAQWTSADAGVTVTVGPQNGCRRPSWAN